MSVERKRRKESDKSMSRALWYMSPGITELREASIAAPLAGEALVRSCFSLVSRGTERLVFRGEVPDSITASMRAPMQDGDFPFPVKYGYCAVGIVEAGPTTLVGRTVFALHPHQDVFVAPADALALVPPAIPPRRATLGANMETALNAMWDSGAGPGDRIVVVGAGVVGLLVATLAARLPGAQLTVIDTEPSRRAVVELLGARFSTVAEAAQSDADVVFHASASEAGLATALACAGVEATVVELSWYGARAVSARLGAAFHARRLRLISSQVGMVSPGRRPRWSHARRLAMALALLDDARLDALFTNEIAFAELPTRLPAILAPGAAGLATAIRY